VPSQNPPPITQLLHDASAGDDAAKGALLEQVYDQLRTIARERMAHERGGHTLQATALVHEAYLRLMAGDDQREGQATWVDRGHFYRAAAEAMRRILIDHARHRGREKRGGSLQRLPINVCDLATSDNATEILALDDAITRLQADDEAAADIVRLRFFAGLTVEQTAAALGLSERTIKREWSYARAKLFHMLEQQG
jgi:RNA polymerase sigma factor (TIGR02999 family)